MFVTQRFRIFILTAALLVTAGVFDRVEAGVSRTKPSGAVLHLRVSKPLKGGWVEILTEQGEKVTSHQLRNRKMVIDFSEMSEGKYLVRIQKGLLVKECEYIKL